MNSKSTLVAVLLLLHTTYSIYSAEMPRSLREAERLYQNGKYSEADNDDAKLLVKAPEGYILQLTGYVNTKSRDYIQVYDNDERDSYKMVGEKYNYGTTSKWEDIGVLYTTGTNLFIDFHGWYGYGEGLDLTLRLVSVQEAHNVSVSTAVGGVAVADPTSAGAAAKVTVTATPDSGYLPNSFTAVDNEGRSIPVAGGWYTSNVGTMNMPGTDVTITPHFTNILSAADGGLSVNIPRRCKVEDARVVTVPAGIESFKVYDCGGPDGYYDSEGNGYLLINAPAECIIEVSGTVTSRANYDGLRVYDGATTAKTIGPKTLYGLIEGENIGVLRSTGNQMLLCLYTQYPDPDEKYAGCDLTVTVVNTSVKHSISVASVEHGSVEASSSEAGASEDITLSVKPDSGYYLNELIIKDASGNEVFYTGGLWHTGTSSATFKMASSDVTVTPVFKTKDELFYLMPVAASRDNIQKITCPAGVTHFKIYDNGGEDGNYSNGVYGYALVTAPMGYCVHVSGTVKTVGSYGDELIIYDGSYTYSPYKVYRGSNVAVDQTSTGRDLLFVFESNESGTAAGVDVTVDFVLAKEQEISLNYSYIPGADERFYMTTFYHPVQAFELPEGAQAFTVRSDHSLALVGDGSVIPANCPVIIIKYSNTGSTILLKATDRKATPEAGNILTGVSNDTTVSDVYVLYGTYSNSGFFKYSGVIKSGKAYIAE